MTKRDLGMITEAFSNVSIDLIEMGL